MQLCYETLKNYRDFIDNITLGIWAINRVMCPRDQKYSAANSYIIVLIVL